MHKTTVKKGRIVLWVGAGTDCKTDPLDVREFRLPDSQATGKSLEEEVGKSGQMLRKDQDVVLGYKLSFSSRE